MQHVFVCQVSFGSLDGYEPKVLRMDKHIHDASANAIPSDCTEELKRPMHMGSDKLSWHFERLRDFFVLDSFGF